MASSSSLTILAPPSSLPHNWKHHVFPSFHGADVRKTFLSHIAKELRSKGINLFIDNNIERSKSIGPELIDAIRGSRIAIVVLSENYTSSTWCLNELAEIIKCREELGQTVISLFYQVDPTHVKKQTGDFGKVFKKTCKGKTEEEIRRWKRALTEVAQIAGYHSTNWETEAEMIEAIATDVSNKLNNSAPSNDFDALVGMESHMTEMGPFLQMDSNEVRKIGIWGPPGIGKTTIARYIFNEYSRDFQLSVFMDNIKKKWVIPAYSDDYSVKLELQKQFMSQLTYEKDINITHLGVVKDRLKDKKVLVVLDDVDRSMQVEAMAKETCWFGPGSRIIVTAQDQRVLKESGVEHIHKVNLPSSDEALQMFCMYAFDQKYPKDGFHNLAWNVRDLLGRLPLGLKVMGSYFRGMSERDWIEALPRLKTHLDQNTESSSILRFSYDALHDEDKCLFLHIACFFNGEPVDMVERCLATCFRDVTQGLHILAEKSLISLERRLIEMDELLVQLGRKIMREQTVNEPGKWHFLNDAFDIDEVLVNVDKAGSGSVIGISLDEPITHTCERSFERFSNLQFLWIRGDYLVNPQSLNYISQKLRVLCWRHFPLTCFTSSFNPKSIVKLEMPFSKLEKLWEGIQPLSNLIMMDLSYSVNLKELPDLSTATNLCDLNLKGCNKLAKVPSSVGNAVNLKKLDLTSCRSLVEIPSSITTLTYLESFGLIGCGGLVELPFNIETVGDPEKIDLSRCSSLLRLPSSICTSVNLQELNLSRCSSLVELPLSIGNAINLKRLDLTGCLSLMELPSSMRNLRKLSKLKLEGCSRLEVNLANINLESLYELNLSGCSLLKSYSESLTGIQELDPCIGGRVSRLRRLVLSGMKKLVSLPQLPDSVVEIDAEKCRSLERLDCSFRNPDIRLNFANCFKLNQEARDLIIHTPTNGYTVFPYKEVPQCFTYRSFGSSVNVKLNRLPLGTSTKFKAGIIYAGENENHRRYSASVCSHFLASVCCSITSGGNALTSCYKRVQVVFPRHHLYTFDVEVETEDVTSTELVFDFEIGNYNFDKGDHESEASSISSPKEICKAREIKECGILQLLEVPLLSSRDGDEPSDTESVGDKPWNPSKD